MEKIENSPKKFKPLSAAKDVSDSYMDLIIKAVDEHLKRKARTSNPEGSFDNAKRFYLDKQYACCEPIRSPSRSFPYSQMTHARSVEHVAHEFGVEAHVTLVRTFAKVIDTDGLAGAYALLQDRPVFRDMHLCSDLGL